MNTKKAITITAIAIALTGLITCAIFLTKKTGIKPKIQETSAYFEINSISGQATNPNWSITGQPTNYDISFYQNNGLPTLPKFEYTISYNKNTLTLINNVKGFYYLDTNENPNEINYTAVQQEFPETRTLNNITKKVIYIEIKIQNIRFTNVGQGNTTSTRIDYLFHHEDNTYTFMPITNYVQTINAIFNDDIVNADKIIDIEYLNLNTYTTGYTTGYQIKGDLEDGNFTSIQETMLNVLTMPFTFISQGFNVTLFEGTEYAINIGNFIKSLIAIATILFIIKMFTTGFAVIGNYTSNRSTARLDKEHKKAKIERTKAETRRTNNLADKGK